MKSFLYVLAAVSLGTTATFLFTGCHSLYRRSYEQNTPSISNANSPVGAGEKDGPSKRAYLVEEDEDDFAFEPSGPSYQIGRTKNRPNFDWPVDEARLTRGFSATPVRTKRSRKKRPHLGLDLAAPKGSPIYSAHDGTVIYVGKGFKGYGRLIVVEDKKGWATLYAHLTQAFVREGQRVLQGEKIGSMGKTGRAFGVHLHFEIRTLQGPVDPLDYLPKGALVSSGQ